MADEEEKVGHSRGAAAETEDGDFPTPGSPSALQAGSVHTRLSRKRRTSRNRKKVSADEIVDDPKALAYDLTKEIPKSIKEPVIDEVVGAVSNEPSCSKVAPTSKLDMDRKKGMDGSSRRGSSKTGVRQKNAVMYDKDRPFPCGKCSKRFYSQRDLNTHDKRVHSDKVRCAGCCKLLLPSSLTNHFKGRCSVDGITEEGMQCVHVEENGKRCQQIERQYDELVKHIVKKHPNKTPRDQKYFDMLEKKQQEEEEEERLKGKINDQKMNRANKRKRSDSNESTYESTMEMEVTLPVVKMAKKVTEKAASVSAMSSKQQQQPSLSPGLEFYNKALKYPSLGHAAEINLSKRACKNPPAQFQQSCEIILEQVLPMIEFSTFIRFFHQTGLAKSGAILVNPPQRYRSLQEDFEWTSEMMKMKMDHVQTFRLAGIGVSNKSYLLQQLNNEEKMTILEFDANALQNCDNLHQVWDCDEHDQVKWPQLIQNGCGVGIIKTASLFDCFESRWNLSKLNNDLTSLNLFEYNEVPECGKSHLEVYQKGSIIPLQTGPDGLGVVSYLHYGSGRTLFTVPSEWKLALEEQLSKEFPEEMKKCETFFIHSKIVVSPELLDEWKIPFSKVQQPLKKYTVIAPGSYFFGYNEGLNVVEAVNYLTYEGLVPFLTASPECRCMRPTTWLRRRGVIQKYHPEWIQKFTENKLEFENPFDKVKKNCVRVIYDVERQIACEDISTAEIAVAEVPIHPDNLEVNVSKTVKVIEDVTSNDEADNLPHPSSLEGKPDKVQDGVEEHGKKQDMVQEEESQRGYELKKEEEHDMECDIELMKENIAVGEKIKKNEVEEEKESDQEEEVNLKLDEKEERQKSQEIRRENEYEMMQQEKENGQDIGAENECFMQQEKDQQKMEQRLETEQVLLHEIKEAQRQDIGEEKEHEVEQQQEREIEHEIEQPNEPEQQQSPEKSKEAIKDEDEECGQDQPQDQQEEKNENSSPEKDEKLTTKFRSKRLAKLSEKKMKTQKEATAQAKPLPPISKPARPSRQRSRKKN